MATFLSLSAPDLNDESLQELTRQLCQDLRSEAGIESSLVEQPAGSGMKGDLVTIGQIALGAGGPLVALIGVLKVYAQRKPSLQVEFQSKDGDRIKITADDLRGDHIDKLIRTIKSIIEGRE